MQILQILIIKHCDASLLEKHFDNSRIMKRKVINNKNLSPDSD